MIYLRIYLIFFKIGLFTIGGGLAALPLLQESLLKDDWVTHEEFIDMIAVSQSTPGPIGINMATYAGFKAHSVLGALVATAGMVTPSVIIIILIARFMRDFNDHPSVQSVLAALRPTSVGLIAAATWFIFGTSVIQADLIGQSGWFDWKAAAIFVLLATGYRIKKAHPIIYIVIGGLLGIVCL